MDSNFLSVKEFAAKLNVHPNTIRRAIRSSKIQAVQLGNGRRKAMFRIPESELNRILAFDLRDYVKKIIEEEKKDS